MLDISRIERALLALKPMRNSLFHGGKGFSRDNAKSDEMLLAHGLRINAAVLSCDQDVQADFVEQR